MTMQQNIDVKMYVNMEGKNVLRVGVKMVVRMGVGIEMKFDVNMEGKNFLRVGVKMGVEVDVKMDAKMDMKMGVRRSRTRRSSTE